MPFGPDRSFVYRDYTVWARTARAHGMLLVISTNGLVAQNGPCGACHGAWFFNSKRGWLVWPAAREDQHGL